MPKPCMWSDNDEDAATVLTCDDFTSETDDDASPSSGGQQRRAGIIEDPEVWMDYWSDDLLDLWYSVKRQCDERGCAILNTAQFPDFAQFCFQFSTGHRPAA